MIKFVTDEQIVSDSNRVNNGQPPPYFQDDDYPSKILCFFCADDDPEVYAIVQSCEKETKNLTQSSHSSGEKSGIKYLLLIFNQCCKLCQLIHLASMFMW